MAAKHSDQIDAVQERSNKAATKEDIVEMKKSFYKPLQDKQDQMDDRLKRLERSGGGGGSLVNEAYQGSSGASVGGTMISWIF